LVAPEAFPQAFDHLILDLGDQRRGLANLVASWNQQLQHKHTHNMA
jgi:hypothetical protein